MSGGRTKLILVLIISEALYLNPLYQLAAVGLGVTPVISPWLFIILPVLLCMINIKLNALAIRIITIVLLNILLILPASLIYMQLQSVGVMALVLSLLFIFWLLLRSIYLSVNTSLDIFGHFDLSIFVILVILLIAGSLKIPLSTGSTWLMISFLANIVTISLYAGKGQGYLSWLGAVVSSVILVPMFFTARYYLPFLFEPAKFIYSLGKPLAEGLQYIVGGFLAGYVSYLANRREQSSNMATDTNSVQVTGGISPVSPALEMVMKVISIIFLIIMAIAVLSLLIYLLRFILVWIFRRQGKPVPRVLIRREKISWLTRLKNLLLIWDRLKMLLIPWLPVEIDIVKAYRALLKWGSYRRIPRSADETPYEYLCRLQMEFPQNQKELHTLTSYFVQYRYGQESLTTYTPEDLKNILRRIFYPRLSTH